MQEDCQPIWSKWIAVGPCVVTGCSLTTGERKKSRECLYGDGSETMNYDLCSNNSAIVTEQCNSVKLSSDCKQFSFNTSDSTGVYIGVGLFFTILVSLVYCCWRKKQQNIADRIKHSSTNIPIDIEHHVYNQIQRNTN